MIDWLESLNYYTFFLINGSGFSEIDPIMLFFSNKIVWIPLYIIILYFLFNKYKEHILKIVISIALLIFCADVGSVYVFKNQIKNKRPCHIEQIQKEIRLVADDCGGEYGFISSHAANHFAIAFFVSFIFRNKKVFFFLYSWAAIIGFSRIYLGVHFPIDIIGGMFWGLFVSLLSYKLLKIFTNEAI